MKAIRLRAEYLNHPIGIDIQRPRLQWNCADGIRQTAYQVVCRDEKGILWDSGRVQSSSMWAVYPRDLMSRQQIRWNVRLWDEKGEPGEWNEDSFEMGLLHETDWKADWITGNYKVNKKQRYPVDCLPRTKVRNLMKMGVSAELAYQAGNTRRGYWFATHTVAVNMAMTKERLIRCGFYDLATAYQSVHVNY